MSLSLILVSPKGPANVGGIARLMGNFGFEDLRIVEPRCDLKALECKQMAMRGYSFIENAKIYSSLKDARQDLEFCIALSGRQHEDQRPRMTLSEFLPLVPQKLSAYRSVALVFGREEWGLKLEELDACDWRVEIETTSENTSINLTSAAAIVMSQIFLLSGQRPLRQSPEKERPLKRQEDLFFDRILNLMETVQFTNPQNPESHMSDLRAMFHRADLSDRDLRILFGLLSGVERHLAVSERHSALGS